MKFLIKRLLFQFPSEQLIIIADRSVLRFWRESVSKLAASLIEADVSTIVISLDES